jgi:hypothetical protein
LNSIVEKPRATELLLKKRIKLQVQKMSLKTFKGPIKKAEVEKSFNHHQGKHNKLDMKKEYMSIFITWAPQLKHQTIELLLSSLQIM